MNLSRVRFVLIETSHPGNIGAAARAMCNMDVGELVLLKPKCYPAEAASARAAGAADYLSRARVAETLADAVGDCSVVLGASARQRRLPWPTIPAHELGGWLVANQAVTSSAAATSSAPAASAGPIAILFGREASGLNNKELQACAAHIIIDANPEYSSLNLAMAVQIIAYELRIGAERAATAPPSYKSRRCEDGALALPDYWDAPEASQEEVEHLLEHWDELLRQLAFYESGNPRRLLARIRRMTQRIRLDHLEVGLLRGFLRAVQEQAGFRRSGDRA